jgi:cation diffusion facilitator CzcD-associated flavoprotein CzcO
MTPKHLIQATGLNGEARLPDIPGIQDFKGDRLVHSSNFPGATDAHRGKKIIVVGTGNSGHDIAQDFCQHGAHVTMVQRSSTCVITLSSVRKLVGALYREGVSPSVL